MKNVDILVKKDLCMKIKMDGCFQNRKDNENICSNDEGLSRYIKN